MPIWFVYRSPYHGPMSKYVKRLDGPDTLLGWFRSVWRAIPDGDHGAASLTYAEELLGIDVYGFGHVFVHASDNAVPRPETMDHLHEWLERALYVREYRGTDDTIQVLSDYDEAPLAMYWFTDAFAKARPERVAYLLREDWHLSEAVGPGGFKPEPGVHLILPHKRAQKALYVVEQNWDSICEFEWLSGGEKLPGLRLPDLVPWLMRRGLEETEGLGNGRILLTIREELDAILSAGKGIEAAFRAALKEQPDDAATWNAYTDWLADQDLPRAELHLLELALRGRGEGGQRLQVAPHCVARMQPRDGDEKEFHQLFLFDDLWASGNVDLANAILDYNGRFNVLDDWDVPNEFGPDVPAGEEH